MEFAAWEIYYRKFHLTYVLPWNFHPMKFTPPSEIPCENYSSLEIPEHECPFPGNFKVNVPAPLEIPRLMYPSPGNLKLMHLFPGNSKVNAPPPLEIPRLMHPLPWKFKVNAPLPWKFQG
jgi:hypothetical protein